MRVNVIPGWYAKDIPGYQYLVVLDREAMNAVIALENSAGEPSQAAENGVKIAIERSLKSKTNKE